MNGAIVNLLNKILGRWVENFNSEQLNLSIFSGVVVLEDLKLRSDIIQVLGLPFEVCSSSVGKIQIKIPWTAWYSNPLSIEISNVCIYLKPIHQDSWCEESERSILVEHKKYLLEQFEIMHPDYSEVSTESGFLRSLVSRLVDNVQIEIKNVYLRFEDSINYSEPFAMGLVLSEATIYTCNELWEPNFQTNTSECFKLIQVENLTVFIDYGDGIVSMNKWYEGSQQQVLKDLALEEINGMLFHRHILFPFTARGELVIDKDPSSNSKPKISFTCLAENLRFQIFTTQMRLLVKLTKYLSVYKIFSKGIERSTLSKVFSREQEAVYKIKYRKLRKRNKSGKHPQEKMKKLRKKVEKLEEGISIYEIKQQRVAVLMDLSLESLQKTKEKEIETVTRSKRRFSTRVIDLIGLKTKAQQRIDDLRHSQHLTQIENDLRRVLLRSNSIVKQVNKKLEVQPEADDLIKFSNHFKVTQFSFELLDESVEYLSLLIQDISCHLILRPYSKMLELSIGKSSIINNYSKSSRFPKFYESDFLHIIYDGLTRQMLKVQSGEFSVFIDLDSMCYIAGVLRDILIQDLEFARYLDEMSETTERYVAQGQQYLKDVMEAGTAASYYLEIDMRAPVIVIPLDSCNQDSPVLFLDFGILSGRTTSRYIGSLSYDAYRFELCNLRVFTEKCEPRFSEILAPVSLSLDILACKTQQFIEPGFHSKAIIGKTDIFISDKILVFLASITNKSAEFSAIFENKSESTTTRIRNLESKQNTFVDVVPKVYQLELEECSITLIESSICFSQFLCKNLKLDVKVSRVQSTIAKCVTQSILLQDLRNEGKPKDIVGFGYPENPEETFEDAREDMSQLKIVYKSDLRRRMQDVSVKLFDIKLIASLPFYTKLMGFYRSSMNTFTANPKGSEISSSVLVERTSKILIFNSRLSIQCQDFEMLFPLESDSCWELAHMRFNIVAVYTTQSKFYSRLSPDKKTYILSYLEAENDGNAMLNHVDLQLRKGNFTKNIIQPSRITVDYSHKTTETGAPETQMQARMESLCITIGFRDYDFLQKLKSAWYSVLYSNVKPSTSHQNFVSNKVIDFDSLQITIQEDTTAHPYSLAFLQFSNFFGTSSTISSTTKNSMSTVVFMNYYNIPLGTWEPLIEDWKVEISTEYLGQGLPYSIFIESKHEMNMNITKGMMETMGILMKRYYQTAADWGEMQMKYIPSQKQLDYEVVNQLGIPIKIWVLDPGVYSNTLQPNQKTTIEYTGIKKMYAKVKPKNKFEVGKTHTACICVQPQGFKAELGLVIEDTRYQIFYMKDMNNQQVLCRKEVEIHNNKRVITLSRELMIVNSTGTIIEISYENSMYKVSDRMCLPLNWDITKVFIATESGLVSLGTQGCLKVNGIFAVVDIVETQPSERTCGTVVSVDSAYIFTNLLPCPINVICGQERICCIFSGDRFNLVSRRVNSDDKFYLELLLTNSVLTTSQINLLAPTSKVAILGKSNWNIISTSKTTGTQPIRVTFFSQYLILNSTDFAIAFGKSLISPHEILFLSSQKETQRLKIVEEFSSDWSDKFNLKAVGVTSCLVLPLSNPVFKNFSLGMQIIQAPDPLVLTKIIKILPRFVLVNYLDFCIYIRQYRKPDARLVEITKNQHVNYQFDNYHDGCSIQVSEDKLQWSGPFSLNNIENFQIRFKAFPREVPKKTNIFAKDKFWYLSCPRNQMFYYVQVHITTENDASISILFSNPVDPNFRIHNASQDPIEVKQSKCKESRITILPGTSVPWAFDNHLLKNKKVTVKHREDKQRYSLEKIKEKNKDIGIHLAVVKFIGDSRVLTIYDVEETELNIKIAIIQDVTQKYIRKINLSLVGINFSMMDEQNTEMFLVSLRNINLKNTRTDEVRRKQIKTRNKFDVIIEKFQIDNMRTERKLFPVVVYQSLIVENTPFFQIRYDREYTSGNSNSSYVVQIDQVLEFELQMQQINLHLNYEFILSMSSLQQIYMSSFFHLKPSSRPTGLLPIHELYPELSFPSPPPPFSSTSINTYFKYVRIHGMNLVLTFKNILNSDSPVSASESSLSSYFLDIASIENSSLRFTEVILQHSFQNQSPLLLALAKNYIRQGLLQFYRILGSSELLGNPIGLIDKLGTGVYEFFNEPAKGLLKGPKGFINGVGKGVRSLATNIIAGSFESVAKISGSLYKIVSYEHIDSENIYASLGILDLATGVSGIVNKPYEGYKKYGAKGLVKGVGLGVYGALVCPLAAVLHLSSTVSSQVAKTAEMMSLNANVRGRVRYPRYIGNSRILQGYDVNLAMNNYFIIMKGIHETQVKQFIELGSECIAVLDSSIAVIVAGEVIEEIGLLLFSRKEVHYYNKRFVLNLAGEKNMLISSEEYAPIFKLYLAIEIRSIKKVTVD